MKPKKLTPRVRQLVETVAAMTEERGYPPTRDEVGEALRVSRTQVSRLAVQARDAGALELPEGLRRRSWKVVSPRA